MGRRGLHLDGIIYTDCPLKLARSTCIYNTSKRTSQIKGSCLYWCVLFLHWDTCASSPGSCVHAFRRQTHMDVFKRLHACMNMHLYRGWMYVYASCVCGESLKYPLLDGNKLQVWAQRRYASVLRWLGINAAVALFSYSGFRANVWKSWYFRRQLRSAYKFTGRRIFTLFM